MICYENLISIGDKATGTANTTVVCYPHPLEGHATYLLVIVKIKMQFPPPPPSPWAPWILSTDSERAVDPGLRTTAFKANRGYWVNTSSLFTSNLVSTHTLLSLGLREERSCLRLALPTGLWIPTPPTSLGICAIEHPLSYCSRLSLKIIRE